MTKLRLRELLVIALVSALGVSGLARQAPVPNGQLRGVVIDPQGAVVPDALITLRLGAQVLTARSGHDGAYVFPNLAPGSYSVAVTAHNFAELTIENVEIVAGQARELKLPLSIAVEHQEVTVTGQNQSVSINPDQNASAMVIRGRDLDALSDDPNELQNELQALAGPSAGPNGGEIYIDGFSGGQIPPKSSILEIRVNQNPFSAEYDRIGYGRVEIITKPGTQKAHGSITAFGMDSAFNTANPLVASQPAYDMYSVYGNVSGPLTRQSSYFISLVRMGQQNQSMVDALNPQSTGQHLNEACPNPTGLFNASERVDFQLGNRNTFTVRETYWRSAQSGSGVGTLNLPYQASTILDQENSLQIGDSWLVNERLVNDLHFQWRRIRNQQNAAYSTPTVTVEGSFTTGGSSAGTVQDHQDVYQLQDRSTATAGNHTLRFGADLRMDRDANYSTSGSNGSYMFVDLPGYLAGTPTLYSATVISNPLARANVVDGSLYLQDDWKLSPNFVLGLGLRYEGQNWIDDHNDWAPRFAFAWSPRHTGTAPAKTVVRAGYGWFYNRFTVPDSFSTLGGAPYVIETLHDNLVNQSSYTIDNPGFYNPDAAEPASVVSAAAVPTYHTIDPHFHAALDMQTGVGVDRQLSSTVTGNISYIYTQGIHQYLSNNITAPVFDSASYTVSGSLPAFYNYQYQSGGAYKQSQIILTVSAHLKKLTFNSIYTYDSAKSDTEGVNSFVSDSQDPGLDYGRAGFANRHEFSLLGSYSAPYAITVAGAFFARSGTPYNLTIGSDPTANNQFNARPTYGTCGETGVISTQYGCLDTDPVGKGEAIVPYGVGIGPANAIAYLRASKVFGIGPRVGSPSSTARGTMQASNSVSDRGISGGGATIHIDAAAPRRYSLTLAAAAENVFNEVNLGTPNGVLLAPLFNQTQSLAGGAYVSPTPGNRTIFLQSSFAF